jgi:D-amino peptidase
MQVLISMDMEGVAGIATRQQVSPGKPDYAMGRLLMTKEASAAAVGAFGAGAESVLISDSHGPMDNLVGEELDPRVEYFVGTPKPLAMVQGLTADTGIVFFVGYHSGPQDVTGVLGHTYNGSAYADIRLNGGPLTELLMNALLAGAVGVPVGLVTGDDRTCALAQETLPPGVVTVQVKEAVGFEAARSLHPEVARAAIEAGAAEAVEAARSGRLRPLEVPSELVVEAEFRQYGAADSAARVPGAERVSARVVRRAVADPRELLDIVHIWSLLSPRP